MLRGYLHNKCPHITVRLIGSSEAEDMDVLVDTGFNGYLTLPEAVVSRLGFTRTGIVSSSRMADGSLSAHIVYIGKIMYNDTRIDIEIDVQPNCKILLGTSLLEELGLSLFVDVKSDRVELNETGRLLRP